MSGRYKFERRRKYPHMIGEDKIIWNRFIEKFPDRFETVDYDWRVGKGQDPNPDWPENMKRMVTMLSQKRIDVIGWVGDSPTIIEVKKRVGLSTIGQVMGYRALIKREFKQFEHTKVLVICEIINSDDRYALLNQDIPVIVV